MVAHVRVPARPSFCAHCTEDREDLALAVGVGGRLNWLCAPCRTSPAQALAEMAVEPERQYASRIARHGGAV